MTTAPEITFDLDTVERDPKDIKPPFVANVRGRAIYMSDPEDFDWQDLLAIQNPLDFLRYCIGEDDRVFLRGLKDEDKIEGWRFGKLMDAYQKHYNLDGKVEEAQRQEAEARRQEERTQRF